MILAISSKQFSFERAQARVIPWDWDSPSNLARRDPAVLLEPIDIVDDRAASVDVRGPGEFLLLLTQLTVRRFEDNVRFHVPWFAADFDLTDADIQQGNATVFVNPIGVFRVSIFDRKGQPLRGRKLSLSGNGVNAQLLTDENGVVLFLVNPTQYHINTETTKIAIESL